MKNAGALVSLYSGLEKKALIGNLLGLGLGAYGLYEGGRAASEGVEAWKEGDKGKAVRRFLTGLLGAGMGLGMVTGRPLTNALMRYGTGVSKNLVGARSALGKKIGAFGVSTQRALSHKLPLIGPAGFLGDFIMLPALMNKLDDQEEPTPEQMQQEQMAQFLRRGGGRGYP